ncbi:hybrid sensor histidine kinase/response regulator transcription factor [Pseudopedobacter beijingensis]|uniref:histidine kinase n=1 Tax=Pseudopedobacter beijingensis TaxID=1207056 RepID=A0ABW4IBP7_9SPHI
MKRKIVALIFIALSFFLLNQTHAEEFPNVFYGNTIEQKWLPNFSIKDIIQDKSSNIWVATSTGLYRYNINNIIHYDITRYTLDKYLNNEISCIVEDQKGNILVGTQSGLGQFNVNANTIKLISEKDQSITHVTISRGNKIIYIVANRDVYHLTPNSEGNGYNRKIIFDGAVHKKNLIRSVIELDENSYFIAASDGLWLLKNNKLYPTSVRGTVNTLYKDGNTLWVGTAFQGVYKCSIVSDGVVITGNYISRNQLAQVESIQEIKEFNEEGVVFATTTKIILANKQHFPNSLKEKSIFEKNTIRKISIDKTMNIWIGSRNGLFSLNPLTLSTQFNSFDNSIYQNVTINDMLSLTDTHILIATSSLGLKVLDTKNNKIVNTSADELRDVRLLRRSRNGDLIIVADRKFLKTNTDSLWKFSEVASFVSQGGINDVVEVAPDEFWFSHWRDKIIRVKGKKVIPHLDKIYNNVIKSFSSNVHVYVLELDSKNNLWVGTRGEGLLRVNLTTQSMKKFGREDKFPDQILCIKEDSQNRLWVGTRDKGLLLYKPESNSFKVFNHNDGLPSNTISAIQENSIGEVWLSTLNGIAQLNEGKVLSFRAYNKESGIYNAEFSFNISEAGKDGAVYFGADNGIYRFFKISQKHHAIPPLEWTNIDLVKGTANDLEQTTSDNFSKEMLSQVEESGTIVLQHNQNSLQIGFAKLDYTLPKQNFYMYRLLGHDTAWSVLQGEKSMVRYFNLPAGDYMFQAMTTTSNGAWDSAPKSFAIIIKPSFWKTGYAIMIYFVLIIIMGLVIYKIIYRWRSINRKLEKEMESSRIYDQQMVYYADLSHEIKNRLTLIMGPLEEALKNKKVNFQMLNRIYEQGQRLKRFSDQIMNIRKSESGDFLLTVDYERDIVSIISKIVEDARPLAMVKDINIIFEPLQEEISGWCDAEVVEIISMNVLNNAIKYCTPSGTVKVSLDVKYLDNIRQSDTIEGNNLVCIISDTGIGIAEEDISKILLPFYRATDKFNKKDIPGKGIGLDLVARLIKKHHGNMEISSEINEYTSFTFYLPIDKTVFTMNELLPDIKTEPIVISEKNFKDTKSLIFPDSSFENQKRQSQHKKKYKLLLIDDDEEMLSYLEEIFKEEFLVMLANGGEQAIELMNLNEINLIVCDLDMPGINGLTLCGIFKNKPEFSKIPFLLLTGRDSEEQKLVAFENGVDDFVEKPFRSELLSWRVKSLLKNSIQFVKPKTVFVSEPEEIIKETKIEKFIQEVIDLIEKHIDKDYLNVDYLADEMCMSRATFYRKMEEMFGEAPSTFIRKYRLKKAVIYIRTGNYSLKQISDKTGFSNPKYFSKCFKSEFGVLPSEYYRPDSEEETTY